jgi:single-stranded-DNA-specific exonuclease
MASQARWKLREIPEDAANYLARCCSLSMPAARVLWGRGIHDEAAARQFLKPELRYLHDPFLMRGMDRAVDRLRRALSAHEPVMLYGDYDVDGISSVVLLLTMLRLMGHDACFHVPDRLKDGYGMQCSVVEQAARDGIRLIVTLDTGIRALLPIARARELGIDVIVTDHHLPEDGLPDAYAILNPNQPDCPYPNKGLCGAGVALKLIQALMERESWPPHRIATFSDSFLVMAAIATVADVVPLVGENRTIVKRGLERITRTTNEGLKALLNAGGVEPGSSVSTSDIGFRVAPRINAAGRMDNASDVVELFMTQDADRARAIAARLDGLNIERQKAGEDVVRDILDALRGQVPADDQAGLVFYDPAWHRGVVGIVASRVVEMYHRPALVLGRDDNTGFVQGSGRSIPSFHLLDALETIGDVFVRFGGHRQAVGVTLEESRVEELRERFNAAARKLLSKDDMQPQLDIDAELRLLELNDASAAEILQLAPFGLDNPAPLFMVRDLELRQAPEIFGREGEHVRFRLYSGDSCQFAKAWRFADRASQLAPGSRVDVVLTVDADTYGLKRGYAGWGVTVRDVRPASA